MSKIALIDADLIGRKKHRYPNLALMKLSAYNKSIGNKCTLELDYNNIGSYDQVYISKVFTDTIVPDLVTVYPNVKCGGTGFNLDKFNSEVLDDQVEHHMPDYTLYDNFSRDLSKRDGAYYRDYSIGFLTRHCFRKCFFCVNKNYDHVDLHSPLVEFLDQSKPYICLWDDNILGHYKCDQIINELIDTSKPFQFKQGMDIRLLTESRAKLLARAKYRGDFYFAFDMISDKELVIKNLNMLHRYTDKKKIFYVFCGFEKTLDDIISMLERIKLLLENGAHPYIMRHSNYVKSPFKNIYINIARWMNQRSFAYSNTFRDFCVNPGQNKITLRTLIEFEQAYPEIAAKYFNLKLKVQPKLTDN